ncbi:extracellular solute-binding protein, partial [Candidatus Bipolaricaulota bacterium]|nr:extracellular solute-binding protein [Candidatus Bipolaricaulota bacterium]
QASLPIYRQLKEIIKEKIEDGKFRSGDRIPTEYELCDQFEISRAPVRQALAELVNEGFLYRQQGSGTFVNHHRGETAVSLRVIVTEDLWIPSLNKAVSIYNGEQASPRLKLEVETLGRPQLRAKILSAVGRGAAPDIALIDWAWVSEFADLHFLKRLDILDREWAEEVKADLFPAFVDNSTPALYGVQPEASVSLIWYRKDWFEREGQTPPQTWEDLVLTANHFKRFVEFPLTFVASCRAGETTIYQLLPFLRSTGGKLFSQGKVALDDNAVRAVRFLVDLVHKYRVASPEVVSFEWHRAARLLAQGRVAMAIGGSYEKALIQKVSGWNEEAFRERVGCIPIPAGPAGESASTAGGMVYVIFRQSREAKLALDILKRVVSPPLMREFCTKTGRSPTRVSVAQTMDPERAWFSYRVSKLLHSAGARPAIPEYAKVSEQLQLMIENAISKRMSPQQAVEKAREIIAAMISR